MKLHTCYLCDTLITAENKTTEHIILNAIGGRLKAGYLLCRSCNSTAGHRADAALAKQLEALMALLGIERERGDIPVLKGGKSEDGKEYDFHGEKIVPSKPVFTQTDEGTKKHISISARSIREMEAMLRSLAKKYPVIDVAEAMKQSV